MISAMAMGLIGAGTKAIGGTVKGVLGYIDRRKGVKALERLGDAPEYEISDEVKANQNIARYYGQQGLDENTLYNYKRGLERNLTATTSAVMNAGGSVNAIGRAEDKFIQGQGQISALNFQALQQNRKALMTANNDMAQAKDRVFAFKLKNYNNQREEANNLRRQGTTAMLSGITDIAGAGMDAVKAMNMPSNKMEGSGSNDMFGSEQKQMLGEQTQFNGGGLDDMNWMQSTPDFDYELQNPFDINYNPNQVGYA